MANGLFRQSTCRSLQQFCLVSFATFLTTPLGFAALNWETMQMDVSPWAGDKNAVAEYHFQNVGSTPVTIIEARPSCTCTTVALSKTILAPGEKGTLKATFEVGKQTGDETKLITVLSNDAPSKPTVLILQVRIQQYAILDPKFIYWRIGDPLVPKKLELHAAPSKTISVRQVIPNNTGISLKIETVEEGKKYVFWAAPTSTKEVCSVAVPVSISVGGHEIDPIEFYAAIVK